MSDPRLFRFSVGSNVGDLVPLFEGAILNVKDFKRRRPGSRSLWDRIYDDLRITRLRLIRSQGAAEGIRWPGYTYAERRYVLVKSKILGRRITDEDQLRWQPGVKERLVPSLTQPRHRLGIGWRPADRAPLSMTYGSKAKGADNHERGVGTPPRWAWPREGAYTIPKRPFLTIGATTRERFERTLVAYASEFTAEIGVRSDQIGGLGELRGGG